jgi:thiamine transport system substrate-binding protein
MRRRLALGVAALAVALVATACSSDGKADGPEKLTLVTHDSFAVGPGVLEQFTAATGIAVDVAKGQDAGVVLNRAILTKDHPEGDVLWGVDNTLLSRAVREGVFQPYRSPALADLDPQAVALVPGNEATPVDYSDVCVNIDSGWFSAKGVAPPATLDDLADPAYRGRLVVPNPATSSTGLAFLLATVARYGDPGYLDYWKRLRQNDVEVVEGWTQAYDVEFSGSSGKGPKPLVVSYASSPPAEVVFAPDPKPSTAPTTSMTDGCFHQVEFAGILKGTKHEAAARQLVDFLVSRPFQEDMPLNMFVFPVLRDAALPAEFTSFAVVPAQPLSLPPADIDANRERWIAEWTNAVLR